MGQVMAIVSLILGLAVAWPCLVIWFALAFPGPAARAKTRLLEAPFGSILVGAVLGIVFGWLSVALLNNPAGPLKLAGWLVVLPVLLAASGGPRRVQQIYAGSVGGPPAP